MWRLANCVYRAFRNTATHRCSQDVLIPLTTVCNTDDDSNSEDKNKCSLVKKCDIYQVLKKNQFSYQNLEKLQEILKKISIQQIVAQKTNVVQSGETTTSKCKVEEVQSISSSKQTEVTLDSLLQNDETCLNTIKELSELHEETTSIVNLEIALEALESGNFQVGIETLQASAKNRTNPAALYNLGICYERGIGVEQDRAKACDYYRQASALGHVSAQFNLTLLSNHIDINEDEDESPEQTIIENRRPSLREVFLRFSLSSDYKEDQSLNDYQFDFNDQTIACLS